MNINMPIKKFYFQGDHGAFSEEAGLKFFGFNWRGIPCKDFEDVVINLLKDKTSFGILPIENSTIGSIHSNYDLLLKYDVPIIGEFNLIVKQHLISLKRTTLKSLKRIISHPAALQQCQKFIRGLKNIDVEISYDTAGSVKLIKENKLHDTAAIASETSAKLYEMKILKRNVQDTQTNLTRFIIISTQKRKPKKNPKTSIVFRLENYPGSLYRALSVFALRDINLTKIESRPIPEQPFEYYFYLDFLGDLDHYKTKNALKNLEEISHFIKILGCYEADFRKH